MLFIVAGITVDFNKCTLTWTYIHVGCCCAYMYVEHINVKGRRKLSSERGGAGGGWDV